MKDDHFLIFCVLLIFCLVIRLGHSGFEKLVTLLSNVWTNRTKRFAGIDRDLLFLIAVIIIAWLYLTGLNEALELLRGLLVLYLASRFLARAPSQRQYFLSSS